MKMNIYNPDDTVLAEVIVLEDSFVFKEIKGEHSLKLVFDSPEYIEILEGSYVMYESEKYILMSGNKVEMEHSRKYSYTVTFESSLSILSDIIVRNPSDGQLSFPYTASAEDHMMLIVENLNRYDNIWNLGEVLDDGSTRYLQYEYVNCRDALDSISELFGTEWEIVDNTIYMRKVERGKENPLVLQYGQGNGLRGGIVREIYQRPVTRVYTQGGSRNINSYEYGSTTLLLPKSVTYRYDGNKFENEEGFNLSDSRSYTTDELGTYISSVKNSSLMVNEKAVDCTDIYPTSVHSVLGYVFPHNVKSWTIVLDVPESLDYSQYVVIGKIPSLTFQSGNLQGKTFKMLLKEDGSIYATKVYSDNGDFTGWSFLMKPLISGGITLPDSDSEMSPANGDKCKMFGFELPSEYICDDDSKSGASWDMLRRGIEWLYNHEDYIYTINIEIDPIYAKSHWSEIGGSLVLGGYVKYINDSWASGGMIVRIQSIRQGILNKYSIEISLSNGIVGGGLLKDLSNQISSQYGSITEMQSENQDNLEYSMLDRLRGYVTTSTSQDVSGIKKFTNGLYIGSVFLSESDGKLRVSKTVVSDGDVVAFGDEEGQTPGTGLDVQAMWDELGEVDSTKVIDASHIPSLPMSKVTGLEDKIESLEQAIEGIAPSVALGDIVGLDPSWVDALGSAMPSWLTEVYLSTIKDLHASWDDVLSAQIPGWATQDWVSGNYLPLTGGTITGSLTVQGKVTIGTVVLECVSGRLHVSGSVTSDGDIVAYGDDEESTPSSGLDIDRMWEELADVDSTKVIDVSHIPTLGISKIEGLQDELDSKLESVALGNISGIDTGWMQLLASAPDDYVTRWPSWSEITSKPTTLSGYGITDGVNDVSVSGTGNAVTSAEVAGHVLTLTKGNTFVDLTSAQTITGVKTFAKIKIGSVEIYETEGRLRVSGSITSSGDIVAYGDDTESGAGGGLDVEQLWEELSSVDSSRVIDASHIPTLSISKVSGLQAALDDLSDAIEGITPAVSIDQITDLNSGWDSLLKAAPSAYITRWPSWSEVTGKPSAFTPSSHTHTLSQISDLNSSWDDLLDTAPSSYVTRWPSWSEVTGKPTATATVPGIVKAAAVRTSAITTTQGGTTSGRYYGVELDSSGKMFVNVPWVNTTYSLSSFGITATAAEINKLDGLTATTAELNCVDGVTSGIQTQLDGKAAKATTLAGYGITDAYTKSEADAMYLLKTSYTAEDVLAKIKTVDGSGSGLDADLLDGTHKSGLLTAVNSDSTTNLSVTVGGTVKTVTDLYASTAVKLLTGRTLWGRPFDGTENVDGPLTGVTTITASGDITTTGNIGVGTTSPAERLHVAGNIRATGSVRIGSVELSEVSGRLHVSSTISASGDIVAFGDAEGDGGTTLPSLTVLDSASVGGTLTLAGIVSGNGYALSRGVLQLRYSATAPMLSIHTSPTLGTIEMRSTAGVYYDLKIGGTGGYLYYDASALRWGLGTSAPSYTMHVNGNLAASGIVDLSSSSREVKDIIAHGDTYAGRLASLGKVVDYRYNGRIASLDTDTTHTGLIYEDVLGVMPVMCHMSEGYGALNYLSPDYINTIAGAVQEHTDEIAELRDRLRKAEMRIRELESRRMN